MILNIVLGGLLLMAICYGVLMHHALTISLDERDKWYAPIAPVDADWDYVRGEKEWDDD